MPAKKRSSRKAAASKTRKKTSSKASKKRVAVSRKKVAKKAKKKVARKKAAKKKVARKTAGKKKAVARKKTAKKAGAAGKKKKKKKAASKKKTAKKTVARKAAGKKKAAKKTSRKKTVARKKTAKKAGAAGTTSKKKASSKKKAVARKKVTAKPSAGRKPKKLLKRAKGSTRSTRVNRELIHGIKPYQARSNEDYMNEEQLEHFRKILKAWQIELMREVDRTVHHMQDEASNFPDPSDRATQESEFGLELRTRDRERKLLKKINQALARIQEGEYGYCEETGEEIGLQRLEARPVATLSVEAQERRELAERQFRDSDDRYR